MVKQGGWLRRRLDEIDLFIGSSDDFVQFLLLRIQEKHADSTLLEDGTPSQHPTTIMYIFIYT